MKATVIQPGLLVSLKTSLRGGVVYRRDEIEPDHTDDSGARVARWETERQIANPAEYEAATQARGRARSLVAGVCCKSTFGLLCPAAREQDLEKAIESARAIASEHNGTAEATTVEVFVLIGRIAQDDAEAARAIGSEIRELLDAMQSAIRAADPDAIREAASKARAMESMLSEAVSKRVSDAVDEARRAARLMVKVAKSGERAADVVDQCSVQRIEAARFAFLDLEEGAAVETEAPRARGLDLEPAEA
jgi:ribosomal protein S20